MFHGLRWIKDVLKIVYKGTLGSAGDRWAGLVSRFLKSFFMSFRKIGLGLAQAGQFEIQVPEH